MEQSSIMVVSRLGVESGQSIVSSGSWWCRGDELIDDGSTVEASMNIYEIMTDLTLHAFKAYFARITSEESEVRQSGTVISEVQVYDVAPFTASEVQEHLQHLQRELVEAYARGEAVEAVEEAVDNYARVEFRAVKRLRERLASESTLEQTKKRQMWTVLLQSEAACRAIVSEIDVPLDMLMKLASEPSEVTQVSRKAAVL